MLSLVGAAIIGQIIFWQGLSGIVTAWEARSWAVVPGVVESVEVIKSESEDSSEQTFEPVVTYSYDVAGAHYFADRVDLRDPVKHQAVSAQEVTMNYRKGQKVTVHYDPKNPRSAILEPGASVENWVYVGFGSLLTILGVFAAHALWQAFREEH